MKQRHPTRRGFVKGAIAGGLAGGIASVGLAQSNEKARFKIERPGIGVIGLRYQGSVIAEKAQSHGDIVALADVDKNVREQGRAAYGSTPRIFENYQELLSRKDVDVVLIGSPDHWHVKMAIDACRAGKDVYVEKPLSLTIDEGKLLRKVANDTAQIIQVGSWQRSDHRFRLAVEMVRQGRIGDLQRVDVVLGKNKTGGPFEKRKIPGYLNWNLWQGQTPDVPYVEERCHYLFRWWNEYSGGQLTDWGAHHLDIAQWAIGSNPIEIKAWGRFPKINSGFNVPIDYSVSYKYPKGVLMTVRDHGRNGIMLTGSQGRIFVNRGTISGLPVEELEQKPLDRGDFKLYEDDNLERPQRSGKLDAIINHMGNFFDCIESRKQPISDVESQHRSVTTCHLANISLSLGRKIRWDAKREQCREDDEANAMLKRKQRQGFEIS